MKKPRVLVYDVETAPCLAYIWRLFDENIGLDQIKQDWHVLSWSAKWLDEDKIMYMDQRDARDITNDKRILKGLWQLLNEADFVITQNGNSFDNKKINARFLYHGMIPPAPYKKIDTKLIAKKHFAFTSNKLEYMTTAFNVKYKKLKHTKFPGFSMWLECMNGNKKAWKEMEIYNKHDVLALEELYYRLIPWEGAPDFSAYDDEVNHVTCSCCNSNSVQKRGYSFTVKGKFQRYQCTNCGAWTKDSKNLLSKQKRDSIRSKDPR